MFDESVYMNICKYADDVWFNMCRIKSQTKCRWIKIDYRTSPMRKDKKCLNTINNNNADRFYQDTLRLDMENIYKNFLKYIPKGGKILAAGWGSGRDIKAFRSVK